MFLCKNNVLSHILFLLLKSILFKKHIKIRKHQSTKEFLFHLQTTHPIENQHSETPFAEKQNTVVHKSREFLSTTPSGVVTTDCR